MARKFVAASTQLVAVASTPVTAKPVSIACWFRPVAVNVAYAMVTIDDATVNNRFALLCSTAGQIRGAVIQSGFAAEIAVTTTTYSAGVWAHAGASITSGVISPYLNGVTTGAVATGRTPAGLSRVRVGGSAGGVSSMDGDLAEIGIWNVALSSADMVMLALGVSPLLVRRDALVLYWPFRHGYSPEIDLVGTRLGGLTNAPTIARHPRVLLPKAPLVVVASAAADAVVSGTRHQRQAHGATTRCRAQRRAGARCRRRR